MIQVIFTAHNRHNAFYTIPTLCVFLAFFRCAFSCLLSPFHSLAGYLNSAHRLSLANLRLTFVPVRTVCAAVVRHSSGYSSGGWIEMRDVRNLAGRAFKNLGSFFIENEICKYIIRDLSG